MDKQRQRKKILTRVMERIRNRTRQEIEQPHVDDALRRVAARVQREIDLLHMTGAEKDAEIELLFREREALGSFAKQIA